MHFTRQAFEEAEDMPGIERIKHLLAAPLVDYEAGILQGSQMLGNGGLALAHRLHELANGSWSLKKGFHDTVAGGCSHSLTELFHCIAEIRHINILACYYMLSRGV